MGLKLLHTADWHLCTPGKPELNRLPELIGELAAREGCDLALLAGDLFDGPPDREAVENLKRELARWAIPVFIAPGNHDPNVPGFPWQERWPENVHIFRGELESIPLPELSCRVWGAGYRAVECPPLLADFTAQGPEQYRIGVLHGDALTPHSPYCPITGAQAEASGLHYLALGHIHARGELRRGDTLCGWPGCPMGRGWDETGEKGVYLVDLDRSQIEFRPLPVPRYYDGTVSLSQDALADIRGALPAGGSDHHFRLTLLGEGTVDVPGLLRALPEYPNLTLRDRTTAPVDLWAGAGEDSLEGVLFGILRDAPGGELAARICRAILEGREVAL